MALNTSRCYKTNAILNKVFRNETHNEEESIVGEIRRAVRDAFKLLWAFTQDMVALINGSYRPDGAFNEDGSVKVDKHGSVVISGLMDVFVARQ